MITLRSILKTCFTLMIALSTQACASNPNPKSDSLPLLERFKIIGENSSSTGDWNFPGSRSLNAAHINYRRINSISYWVYLNAKMDSIIIFNQTKRTAHQMAVPFAHGVPVSLLYFHNPDSIFLFIDRIFVYDQKLKGHSINDFYLLDSKGKILNEYSLDNVPYIFKGQINPMIMVRPTTINHNMVSNRQIFIPFSVYLPNIEDTIHKHLNIRPICKFDLSTETPEMLNILIPEGLIGRRFSDDRAQGLIPDIRILSDSTVLYSYMNFASLFLYNLNTNFSTEVFSSEDFAFSNSEIHETTIRYVVFELPNFSQQEKLYMRRIRVEHYKDYKSFGILQLLDENFKVVGYQLYDLNEGSLLDNSNFGSFFFDAKQHLSIRPRDRDLYYTIRIGSPKYRSVEYIEKNYLLKEPRYEIELSMESPYQDRVLQYFGALNIPEGDKVIMIEFDKACVHCLEYLFSAYQQNSKAFISERIFYLFVGPEPSLINQVIEGYKIPQELVLVDDKQIFRKYFADEERSLNPLVHYKNSKEADVFIYDFKTLIKDFDRFLKD